MMHAVASRALLAAVAGTFALAGLAGLAGAQESEESECTCVRAPRAHVRAPRVAFGFESRGGRLGISVAASQDDTQHRGALVREVVEDGPADEAGIREGDVITAVDGQSLFEPLADAEREQALDLDSSVPVQRLLAISRELEPGSEVRVTYERDGVEATTEVVADDVPAFAFFGRDGMRHFRTDPDDFAWEDRHFEVDELRERLERHVIPRVERIREIAPFVAGGSFGRIGGLTLAPMSPSLGEYFEAETGALVLDVESPSSLNLEAGDVILEIDGRRVDDPDHARRILSSYRDGERLSMQVMRKGSEQTVEGVMRRGRVWK